MDERERSDSRDRLDKLDPDEALGASEGEAALHSPLGAADLPLASSLPAAPSSPPLDETSRFLNALFTDDGKHLDETLRASGVSRKRRRELISNPEFQRQMFLGILNDIILPSLPAIMKRVTGLAAGGGYHADAAAKMVLSFFAEDSPFTKVFGTDYSSLSDAEMAQYADQLGQRMIAMALEVKGTSG